MFLADLPDDPADAAVELARRGVLVFPCDPATKRPFLSNGFKGASNKVSMVEGWFKKSVGYRGALIGLVTGVGNGIAVLDIDTMEAHGNDGFASLKELAVSGFEVPTSVLTVRTAGGGRHLYFRCPLDGLKSRNGLAPGVDLKADGGYVIAPPSRRPDGSGWTVEHA